MGYLAVFIIVAIISAVVFFARKNRDKSGPTLKDAQKGPGLGKPPAQP